MAKIARLETEKDCTKVNGSHAAVINFYDERNNAMEANVNALRGKIYTEAEKKLYEETKRVPISINKALAPFRTVIGTLTSFLFDASFLPVGEEDEKLAEVLSKLAIYESERNRDFDQNLNVTQYAFATGRGYRMCWVDLEGDAPRVQSKDLNPFAVYFDPDSVDVITRSDAAFVDLCFWLSADEIEMKYDISENEISNNSNDNRILSDFFDTYDKSADRRHEVENKFNNKYKVIERYYKVSKIKYYVYDGQGQELGEASEQDAKQAEVMGMSVESRKEETLYLAVWAPYLANEDKFLFNGEYYAQPRDPDTRKIMWPIVELVTDNMGGESDGFMEFIKEPIKLINILYTQAIEVAKHSASSYTIDRQAFASDEEADRAIKYGAHSNQRFEVKSGMQGMAMKPIESNNVSHNTFTLIQQMDPQVTEIASATKALQGVSESASTAASLNQQRIEQSAVQLNTFFNYYKKYLQQILKLRYAYWREFYTDELKFRITMPDGEQQQTAINQPAMQLGWNGMPNGEIYKINDIQAAEFDVIITESFKSPTFMQKQAKTVNEIMKNQYLMSNPAISQALIEWLFIASDAPVKVKESYRQNMEQQQQMQQQQAAMTAQQQQQQPGQIPQGMAQ